MRERFGDVVEVVDPIDDRVDRMSVKKPFIVAKCSPDPTVTPMMSAFSH